MNPSTLRRTLLALAIASAQASAVTVSNNGRGQVLIYPYYTVESGISTTLSVTNHTDQAKAVIVRFRESLNARPVLSFNLYLGRRDVWTAGLFSLAQSGPANVTTADGSCTVPGIRSSININLPTLANGQRYVPFRNFAYTGTGGPTTGFGADGGPPALSRTRSGFIEIIEMGTLVPDSPSAIAANAPRSEGCPTLERAWSTGGYWMADPATDMAPPSGGLSGSVSLVDVSNGALSNYRGTALAQFSSVVQHVRPGEFEGQITLANANTDANTAQSVVQTATGTKVSNWPRTQGFKAVSAALAKANIGQEYLVDASLGAATDWVLNFPTRHFHTDPAQTSVPIAPFTQRFVGNSFVAPAACESVDVTVYDRDRTPLTPGPARLCNAVEVVSFGVPTGPSRVAGALAPSRIATDAFGQGYAEYELGSFVSDAAIGGEKYRGLPAIGVWLFRYSNSNARPGQLGMFSGSAELTGTVRCDGDGC